MRVIRRRVAILVLIAAATTDFVEAELPGQAASSPGSPDTRQGRPARGGAGIGVVTSEVVPEPSSPASPEWLTEPGFRQQGLSLLVRRLTDIPLGVSWTRWGSHGRPDTCEPFRGHQWSIQFDEYWVYRCWEMLAGGTLDYFTYFLDEGGEPTLERARWSLDARADLDTADVRAIYDALVDTLTHVLGTPVQSDISGHGSAAWEEKWDFPWQAGLVTTYLDDVPAVRFVIELRRLGFKSVAEEVEDEWWFGDEVYQDPLALRHDVAGALRPRWTRLARAVETTPPSIKDAPEVRGALTRILQERPGEREEQEAHDLVHFAAHLWAMGFDSRSLADALVRRELESMRPLGLKIEPSHYDVDYYCYRGSLLDSLLLRAGENRWTDQAFLSFQEMGWETACDCGWGRFPGANQFRPVVARGEAFLKEHPSSTVRHAVALTVAQAHETAWSLAMGRCIHDDIGWNWTDYVLEAPEHREQAIKLYEQLLREAPGIPALRSVKRRLPRLKLDVDTNYHRFWCMSD